MRRTTLVKKGIEAERDFTWRGGDVSRIESLSDAVFAFSLTLIVVSLEVPGSFAEFKTTLAGFGGFAFSFALLLLIWHSHFIFFRRYGMEDGVTMALNAVLLFLVLFYIYPLKFLSSLLASTYLGTAGLSFNDMTHADSQTFMILYSLGLMAVFFTLGVLYWHAWRQRDELGLDALERYDTVTSIQYHGIYVVWAALSVGLALLGGFWIFVSGIMYSLIGFAFWGHGYARGKRREPIKAAVLAERES